MADPVQTLALIEILLRSLGQKTLALLALVMTFALFCWAMRSQTWPACALAAAFGVGVLWPVLFAGWYAGRKGE